MTENVDVAGLRAERDTAQSLVEAWASTVETLEAHIMDRAAMRDPASPETYLSILRSSVAGVLRDSDQVRAARWADYRRHEEANAELRSQLEETRALLGEAVEALNEAKHWTLAFENVARLDAAVRRLNEGASRG